MPMSPRLLRPRATGFNPKSISGLAGWWDANDSASVTLVSGVVSQWADKSGNGRHLSQSTGNDRPSYVNTVNGKKVLTFNGANTVLWLQSNSQSLSSTAGATLFYVFRANSDAAFSAFNSTANIGHIDRFSDGNCYAGNLRATRFSGVASGLVTSTGVQLLAHRANVSNNTHVLRRNGAEIFSTTSDITAFRSLTTNTFLGVGASLNSFTPTWVHWLDGDVCEVIAVAQTMSDGMFSACEKYLISKWAAI